MKTTEDVNCKNYRRCKLEK